MLFTPCCAACGIAVLKTRRPVLLQIDRSLDFQAFGARCPFDASWELTMEESGKIVSMKQEVLQNVGTDMKGFSQVSSARKPRSQASIDLFGSKIKSFKLKIFIEKRGELLRHPACAAPLQRRGRDIDHVFLNTSIQ